jgi:hypothetical protein
MTVSSQRGYYLDRPHPSGLADVLDLVLDKGLVIDVYLRVSLVGIELLTIDARIVVASVDTYLRFAQAVNRLDLQPEEPEGLPELMQDLRQGGAKRKTQGALEGVKETVSDIFGENQDSDEEDQEEEQGYEEEPAEEPAPRRRRSSTRRERER